MPGLFDAFTAQPESEQPRSHEGLMMALQQAAPLIGALLGGGTRYGGELGNAGQQRVADQQLAERKAAHDNEVLLHRQAQKNAIVNQQAQMAAANLRLREREIARKERADDMLNKRARASAAQKEQKGPPENTFQKAAARESAKSYVKGQDAAKGLDDQLLRLDIADRAFKDYAATSPGGTGFVSNVGGLKKYVSEKARDTDSKLKSVNVRELAQVFEGKSRMMDSDTERRAWDQQTANITNNETTNATFLLGAKAIAMKAQLEATAKRQYVQEHGQIDENYESPVMGRTEAVVSPQGEVNIVPKGQVPSGFEPIDVYASRVYGSAKSRSKLFKQAKDPSKMTDAELEAEAKRLGIP